VGVGWVWGRERGIGRSGDRTGRCKERALGSQINFGTTHALERSSQHLPYPISFDGAWQKVQHGSNSKGERPSPMRKRTRLGTLRSDGREASHSVSHPYMSARIEGNDRVSFVRP
jgi:hypothetical protein